jgi:superfamily I DNA/RNA helicase
MSRMMTPSQGRVYQHNRGHAVVIAVAGAGKTTVLTQRTVRLIRELGVESSRILMTSFTVKAAEEIKKRLRAQLPNNEVQVRTFHSFCYQWLKITEPTFRPKDSVLPDFKAFLRDQWAVKAVAAVGNRLSSDVVPSIVERMRSRGIYAPDAETFDWQNEAQEIAARVYRTYYDAMRSDGYYEIGDVPVVLLKLMRSDPSVRTMMQDSVDYVVVDEYQDTDRCQEQILEILCGRPGVPEGETAKASLVVIGDPNQAIYTFRNADSSLIETFESRWGAVRYVMTENFRSSEPIVQAANNLLRTAGKGRDLIVPTINDKTAVRVAVFRSEGDDIARQLKALKQAGLLAEWQDAAVLYRTNSQSVTFESAFTDADIPYTIKDAAEGFFGMLPVKTLVAYLRVALFDDVMALATIWNRPNRFLATDVLTRARVGRARIADILAAAMEMAKYNARKGVAAITSVIKVLRIEAAKPDATTESLLVKAGELVDYAGYLEELGEKSKKTDYDPEQIIERLFDVAKKRPKPLDFLAHVSLMIENAKIKNREKNGVSLLTIHGAKGMEFQTVFVAGMTDGLLPHANSVLPEAMAEERRLAYVAVTRAKKYLCLSTSRTNPSPYIAEMGLRVDFETTQSDPAGATPRIPVESVRREDPYETDVTIETSRFDDAERDLDL